MSDWYNPKKEDMEISSDGENLEVWLDDDDFGNIYASLKIKDILEKINEK